MAETKYTTVTPVLSSHVGYLTDIRDQIMTLFRFIIMNPGGTSSLWESKLLSLQKLVAYQNDDRDDVAEILGSRVVEILSSMFSDYRFDNEFSTKDYGDDNDGRYTIVFSIFYQPTSDNTTNREPGVISGTVFVDKQTNKITLKYERSEDTNTLAIPSNVDLVS